MPNELGNYNYWLSKLKEGGTEAPPLQFQINFPGFAYFIILLEHFHKDTICSPLGAGQL